MPETACKILTDQQWTAFQSSGAFRGAPVDEKDGFIHLSYMEQVGETAKKHFAGQDKLWVVAVDTAMLGTALKAEPSRGGALFPHLYGTLFLEAVLWVAPLVWGPDGEPDWRQPERQG